MPSDSANPLLVDITRGDMVESRHRAAAAIVSADGKLVEAFGDIDRLVYGRSAIKPLQAIPMVESGAPAAYDLGDVEISLACASHEGEARHSETVCAWLKRIGLSVADLECGAHWPYHEAAMLALARSGKEPDASHNNCSGKHTGFLTFATHMGFATKGYIQLDHPVQQAIAKVYGEMGDFELSKSPKGVDGCGIPVMGMPLKNMALAMARMADPKGLDEKRAKAIQRIRKAVAAEPFMIAGSGRFCTKIMEVVGEKALIKTGAEGVYCGALPGLGLGFALKVDDGAGRASEVICGRLLERLGIFSDAEREKVKDLLAPNILNRAKLVVGQVRPAASF